MRWAKHAALLIPDPDLDRCQRPDKHAVTATVEGERRKNHAEHSAGGSKPARQRRQSGTAVWSKGGKGGSRR